MLNVLGVQVTITRGELIDLCAKYGQMSAMMEVDTEYQVLQKAHAVELAERLHTMAARRKKTAAVTLKGSALMAFVLHWGKYKLPYGVLWAQTVQEILNAYNKAR